MEACLKICRETFAYNLPLTLLYCTNFVLTCALLFLTCLRAVLIPRGLPIFDQIQVKSRLEIHGLVFARRSKPEKERQGCEMGQEECQLFGMLRIILRIKPVITCYRLVQEVEIACMKTFICKNSVEFICSCGK